MSKIFLVAGLGFGDEGKGSIVDYLTVRESADMVVRYNGGAQAAHNVVLSNGKHHTFSQFGSGSLRGARTHLSNYMVVEPAALILEGYALQSEHGLTDIFDKLTIDENAIITTPYHRAANRIKEVMKGDHKHGSCGMGIGETRSDFLRFGNAVPLIKDFRSKTSLEDKLALIQNQKLIEFSEVLKAKSHTQDEVKEAIDLLQLSPSIVAEVWSDIIFPKLKIVDDSYLSEAIADPEKNIIFEGAQGVLLDEVYGFAPYNTWTNITFDNAFNLASKAGYEVAIVETIGVTRTYLTRHGAGPLPTEIKRPSIHLMDKYNKTDAWQGSFRVGHLDMVLLQYALDIVGRVDYLALTHVDKVPNLSRMCIKYENWSTDKVNIDVHGIRLLNFFDEGKQQQHTEIVNSPSLTTSYLPFNLDSIEEILSTDIGIISSGPRMEDKITIL